MKRAWTQKLWQLFPGHRWTICWFRNTRAVLLPFLEGAQSQPAVCEGRHQLLWKRADLDIVDLRGNVPTRLRKLAENEWDAIVLARAGLERLGLLRRPYRNQL